MAGFAIKVKTKGGQKIIKDLTPETTIKELKTILSTICSIPIESLHILSGFPPKTLNVSDESLSLNKCGIASGDTLILEEKVSATLPTTTTITSSNIVENVPTNKINTTNQLNSDIVESYCPGILMKHIVPADNSCLFTSIYFVLNGKIDETGSICPWMRQLIAETVSNDKDNYSEAILGKPSSEYCAWIKNDKSWGGAIEIAIMADYYGIEIDVVDTINAIINRFGEDKNFPHRVFLLFDGVHYDPLYLEPIDGGKIQTIFESSNERIYLEAEQLAKEAKSSRQYTDVNKFTLKCLVCNMQMSGQVQAQQHAKTTGHMNFGEI